MNISRAYENIFNARWTSFFHRPEKIKMVLQVLRSTTARGVKASSNNLVTKRSMGGGAVKTDWTGIDAVVRKYLPLDKHGKFTLTTKDFFRITFDHCVVRNLVYSPY